MLRNLRYASIRRVRMVSDMRTSSLKSTEAVHRRSTSGAVLLDDFLRLDRRCRATCAWRAPSPSSAQPLVAQAR